MKKHLLAAAALATAALTMAPTTTEAIPAFARQTGSACLSCHFMSFPTLAAFGRAFKQNAFTDVGEQALVEDEDLSIPATLNATFVVRGSIDQVKTTNNPNIPAGNVTSTTNYAFPRDTVLLLAGRIGEHTGAFIEFAGAAANWQLMNSFDMGDFKIGLNIANTGFGWTAPIEVSSVFGQHGGMLNGKNISAVENISQAGGGQFLGVALWGGNDLVTAQVGLYAPDGGVGLGAAPGGVPNGAVGFGAQKNTPTTGIRVFVTPTIGDMEAGVGFGYVGGKVANPNVATKIDMNMWFIDAQLQGEAGDVQWGIYADYATAPSKANGNVFTGAVANTKLSGFSIRASVKPVHNLVFTLGYGSLKKQPNAGASTTQKATLIGAEYLLYQNAIIALIYENTKNPLGYAAYNTGIAGSTKDTRFRIEWEALM